MLTITDDDIINTGGGGGLYMSIFYDQRWITGSLQMQMTCNVTL